MARTYIIDGVATTTDRPFRIDGVPIPTPTEYTPSIEDLSSEETGRLALTGKMYKDVVAVKDSYKCKWARLSWADTATIMNAIDGKREFDFTHADPRVPNQWITSKFYVGQRQNSALDLSDPNRRWTGLSLTLIRI